MSAKCPLEALTRSNHSFPQQPGPQQLGVQLMRILSALAIAGAMLVTVAPAAGQITKAPAATTKRAIKAETVAKGLVHPWGLAFLPDGRMLVTERPGRMRIVGKDGKLSEPLQGVPAVYASGQGGLLDVVPSPD